jgi:gamma-glutamylcyclotransferase (GGCT)/AIG2-like uncharacterized protein YtfP
MAVPDFPIGLTPVFVYGTLKPGYGPYRRFCQGRTVSEQAAMAAGTLYQLPLGYPAMVADVDELAPESRFDPTQSAVRGYLLTFREGSVLAQLDDYEQHDPAVTAQRYPGCDPMAVAYQRRQIGVYGGDGMPIGPAWAYVMTPESILLLQGHRIASGNWPSAHRL